MRSILIQSPLEFRLEVVGDAFSQGSALPCTLTIKNHSPLAVTVAAPELRLVLGNLKKAKAKDSGAFQPLATTELERGIEVAPVSEISFTHTFPLDTNFPISDKSQSPFLLFGNEADALALGQALLTVSPHPFVRSVFDSLTTVFSFVNKGETWKAGETTAKLRAPDSRRFSMVDELNLSCKFDGDALLLGYSFTVKKFDNVLVTVAVKKGKAEVLQRWERADFTFGDGFVRQEFVEKMVDEALSAVSSGF